MTDTTDQQAVTVAQSDVDAAMELCAQWNTMSIDHVAQFLARHAHLASVSSASAEPKSGKDAWYFLCERLKRDPITSDETDTCSLRAACKAMLAFAASPEPVPATNQAGEVEENGLSKCTTCGAPAGLDCRTGQGRIPPCLGRERATKWRERWYGSEPQKGSAIVDERGNLIAHFGGDETTHKATTAVVSAHNAALATQPATSQEGEAMALIRDMAEYAPHVMPAQHGKTVCDDYARAAILAATPTPPTLSEDLRAFVVALEQQMEDQDENLPSSLARERGLVWLEGWFDLRAALAQVKAS